MRRYVYSPAHRTETRRRPLEITHPRIGLSTCPRFAGFSRSGRFADHQWDDTVGGVAVPVVRRVDLDQPAPVAGALGIGGIALDAGQILDELTLLRADDCDICHITK